MNKIYKYIVIIVMIVLAIVQVFYIIKIDKGKNIKVYNNAQKIINNHKTLKEFNEELNCLKEKTILSANEINEKWYVKIKIEGNKEELLNEISKLENYNISDYIINKNKDENSIVLEISVKDVV